MENLLTFWFVQIWTFHVHIVFCQHQCLHCHLRKVLKCPCRSSSGTLSAKLVGRVIWSHSFYITRISLYSFGLFCFRTAISLISFCLYIFFSSLSIRLYLLPSLVIFLVWSTPGFWIAMFQNCHFVKCLYL